MNVYSSVNHTMNMWVLVEKGRDRNREKRRKSDARKESDNDRNNGLLFYKATQCNVPILS